MASYAVKEKFDNLSIVSKIKSPVFIVHGTQDEVVPHKNSIELYGKMSFGRV